MRTATILCILLASAQAYAAPSDDYAYAWPLALDGDSAAWQIELTPDVYAAIHDPQLRDVAVIDASGQPVPIAPRAMEFSSAVQANDMELPQFDLPATPDNAPNESLNLHVQRDADGRLRRLDADIGNSPTAPKSATADLLLDASALKAPIDSLWLDWTDNGSVSAQFSITGSDDLQQWHTLAPSASVMSLHQDANTLSRRQIPINARATYLRLHRLDTGAPLANLRVRARTLAHSSLIQPSRVWVDATPLPRSADAKSLAYDYRLPAPLAIDAIHLELASDNSLARVKFASRVQPGDAPNAWQTRAEFTAFRLRQGDSVIGNDDITIASGNRAQDWRIDPATPLDRAPTLRVAFRPDRFVFIAQGSGPYRLVAGSARAHRADYPVDIALAQLRTKLGANWQPPLATIGTRNALAGDSVLSPAAVKKDIDWKTWLLWAILIGAAAFIGLLALNLLRDSKANR